MRRRWWRCELATYLVGVSGGGVFAGAERGSRFSQMELNSFCGWVRATEHSPRGPFRFLERRHCLAEIVERGTVVHVERLRVTRPHPDCGFVTIPENASRHGHRFAHQCLGFFEAL